MMQNKQSLLLTSDWAHKSLKRLSLSSIPIGKQARQLVTILEQLRLNSTQNKQLQQWHRWCAQIRGVRREIERPEGEKRKNQKEHGDDGAAWGKGRQGKANLRGGVAFAVCARNILPALIPSSPSTSTPMLKETEAAAASHVPQKKRSFLLPLVAAVLLPPCSSVSSQLPCVRFSRLFFPSFFFFFLFFHAALHLQKPGTAKPLTHEPNIKSLKQQRMHKSFLSMSSLAAVVAWAAFLFRSRLPSFSRTYPASSSSSPL